MRAVPAELPIAADIPGRLTSRLTQWGDLDIVIENIAAGDATEAFRTFPGGACPCPHWGYLVKGRVRMKFADHDEIVSAGDVFYWPPGHIPVVEQEAEIIEFSPAGEYPTVMAALGRPTA